MATANVNAVRMHASEIVRDQVKAKMRLGFTTGREGMDLCHGHALTGRREMCGLTPFVFARLCVSLTAPLVAGAVRFSGEPVAVCLVGCASAALPAVTSAPALATLATFGRSRAVQMISRDSLGAARLILRTDRTEYLASVRNETVS